MEYMIKFSFYINEESSDYSINSAERNRDQGTFTRREGSGRGEGGDIVISVYGGR